MKEFFSQTNLGHSGHTFWGEEEQHSVKDFRKIEGGNGGVQMEVSIQVHTVRSEDAMLGSCDVLAFFSAGLRGEAGRVMPLPGPPGADGLPGSPGFQGPQGTFMFYFTWR